MVSTLLHTKTRQDAGQQIDEQPAQEFAYVHE